MIEADSDVSSARRNAWKWAALYVVAVFATATLGGRLELQAPWSTLVFLVPMLLLVPMTRAYRRRERAIGVSSPAWEAYSRRGMVIIVLFLVFMIGGFQVRQSVRPDGLLFWTLALLPAMPSLALLAAMARYIRDEQDEYLRTTFIRSILFAAAGIVALATVWGFLEAAGLAPHFPVWALIPFGAMCLGIATAVQRARG